MSRPGLICLLVVGGVGRALLVTEAPLGRVLPRLLSADLVLARAYSVRLFASVHQLSVLLPDQFPLRVLFVTEDEVVGRDRRWIDLLHDLLTLVIAPATSAPIGSLPLDPLLLFEVGAGAGDLLNFLRAEFIALEAFDT